jgi:glutamate synthase (NADPH/NADH) large chain
LYDPSNEHDACGVGFVAHIKGAMHFYKIKRKLWSLGKICSCFKC